MTFTSDLSIFVHTHACTLVHVCGDTNIHIRKTKTEREMRARERAREGVRKKEGWREKRKRERERLMLKKPNQVSFWSAQYS